MRKILKPDFLVNFSLFISSFLVFTYYFIYYSLKPFLKRYDFSFDRSFVIFILVILLITLVIIIYNSICIFINKRVKNISILKVLGLTNRSIILYELKYLLFSFFIDLVLSFVLSLFCTNVLFIFINRLISKILKYKFSIKIYFNIIYFIIYLLFICFISFILNVRKVIRVNPIKNISNPLRVRRCFISFNNYKIDLSFKNYFSNFRKVFPLKVCLILFIYLFILGYLVINYSFNLINKSVKIPNYDLIIVKKGDHVNSFNNLVHKNNVKKYSLFRMCKVKYDIPKEFLRGSVRNFYVVKSSDEFVSGNLNRFIIDGRRIKIRDFPYGFDEFKDKSIIYFTNDFDDYCEEFNTYLVIDKFDFNLDLDGFIYKNNKLARNLLKNYKMSLYAIIYFCLSILVLVILFFILNILYSTFDNRKREFSILNVIGLTYFDIFNINIYEVNYLVINSIIWSYFFIFYSNKLISRYLKCSLINFNLAYIILICFIYLFLYFFIYFFNKKLVK